MQYLSSENTILYLSSLLLVCNVYLSANTYSNLDQDSQENKTISL